MTSEFLPFHGGIGTYAREIAVASTDLGHVVTVFAPNYGQDLTDQDAADFRFAVRRFPGGLRSPRCYPRYARTCMEVARSDAFDRILAADIPFVEMMAATYPLHRRVYEAMVHGSDINKEHASLRGRLLRPARVFERPAQIYANSAFTRSLLLERFPRVDPGRVAVTHLGISDSWFDAPVSNPDLRQSLGIEPGREIIASVARITPRKGQLTLLRAVAQMPEKQRRRLAFVLAGSSNGLNDRYLQAVQEMAKAAAPAQVILPGSLSDEEVKALYRMSKVFCLPGAVDPIEVEGFGLVFLEAAAQGLPAVAGALGGTPEVVRDGETGLLVSPDDLPTIAAAIWRLIENPALQEELSRKAVLAARDFTWRRCARQTFGGTVAAVSGRSPRAGLASRADIALT